MSDEIRNIKHLREILSHYDSTAGVGLPPPEYYANVIIGEMTAMLHTPLQELKSEITRLVAYAVAAEREACAQTCESLDPPLSSDAALAYFAAAIRARSNPNPLR